MHQKQGNRSSSRRRRRSGNTVYGVGTKKSYKGQEASGSNIVVTFIAIVVAIVIAAIILGVVSRL